MGAVIGAAVIAGAATIGSSYLANKEAEKGRDAQISAAEKNRELINSIEVPAIEKMKLILETPELVGEINPELLQEIYTEASALENVEADQGLVDTQNEALGQLSEIAEGGFTEGDLAASRQSDREVNQLDAARRASILQQMAQRGTLDSGLQLAAQLDSAQQANQSRAEAADRLQIQAQQRALQALNDKANLAGNLRTQQVNEDTNVARARDEINRFNTQNSQSVQQANVNARNAAQATNLVNAQNIANTGVNTRNAQQEHNKSLIQTDYANRLGQAQAAAGQNTNVANAIANSASANARTIGAVGGAIASGAGAVGGHISEQESLDKKLAAGQKVT